MSLSCSQLALLGLLLVVGFPVAKCTDDKKPGEGDSPSLWQELLMEQEQARLKKADSNGTNAVATTAAPPPPVTTAFKGPSSADDGSTSAVAEEVLKVNVTLKKGSKVEMGYVCEPEPGPCPKLKHYEMYPSTPEEDFYPSWTYHGFHHPAEWPDVSIDYFFEPPVKELDATMNYRVRQHGSAMHLCTESVTSDTAKCKELMENECINSMPSPINILRNEAVLDDSLKEFEFINYNLYFGFEMFMETDGSQMLFVKPLPTSQDGKRPGIRGGPLQPGVELFLDRISFRTGIGDNGKGSEHTLDGQHFGMELQFFFTADNLAYWEVAGRYKTFEEGDPRIGNQLHVISLFVKAAVSKEQVTDGSKLMEGQSMDALSLAAELFWEMVNKNHYSVVRVDKKLVSLEDFFSVPEESGVYYTYQGSLSHPPCLTHVGWTVFERHFWIRYIEWRRFAYLLAEYSDFRYLAGNIRPQRLIQVKADIDMFIQMKASENQGGLTQDELDEAAENTRDLSPIYYYDQDNDEQAGKLLGGGSVENGGPALSGSNINNSSGNEPKNSTSTTTTSTSAPRNIRSNNNDTLSDNSTSTSAPQSAPSNSNGPPSDIGTSASAPATNENKGRKRKKAVDLFVIRNYIDYQKYFARRVRRSRGGGGNANARASEYDYYEAADGTRRRKSGVLGVHTDSHTGPLLVLIILLQVIRATM